MKAKNPFLRDVQVKIISELGNNGEKHMAKFSKITGTTYSYFVQTIKNYEKLGIIKVQKSGMKKFIKLTSKGYRVRDLVLNLNKELNG